MKGITGTTLGLGWHKGLLKNWVALENEYSYDMNSLFFSKFFVAFDISL